MGISYSFGKHVSGSFEQIIERVIEALKKEGFGVLSDIDVAATLKAKLDKDTHPYRILGACNPSLAYCALSAEPSIGVFLPCNVVVRQMDNDEMYVECMDPKAMLEFVNKPEVDKVVMDAKARLERVLASL